MNVCMAVDDDVEVEASARDVVMKTKGGEAVERLLAKSFSNSNDSI